jgi:hypothetical protein
MKKLLIAPAHMQRMEYRREGMCADECGDSLCEHINKRRRRLCVCVCAIDGKACAFPSRTTLIGEPHF